MKKRHSNLLIRVTTLNFFLFVFSSSLLSSPHNHISLPLEYRIPGAPSIGYQVGDCEYGWDDGTLGGAYYYLNEEDVIASEFVVGLECEFDTIYISEIAVHILTPDDYPPYGWPDPPPDPLRLAIWGDIDKDGFPDGFPIFVDTTVRFNDGWAFISPSSLLFIEKGVSFWAGVTNLDGAGQEGICIDSVTDYPQYKWAREGGVWFNQDYYPGDHMIRAYIGGNNFPSLTHPEDRVVNEEENVHFSLGVSDIDGDSISIYVTNPPPGATFQDSVFDWTPTFCQSGEYAIKFVAFDDGIPSLSDTIEVLITVNNLNRPPKIDAQPSAPWVYAGNPVQVEITLTDPDWMVCHDDTVYLNLIGPGDLTDHGDGTAHYLLNTTAADTGDYMVAFVATDQYGVADTASCQITVEAPPFKLTMPTVYAYPSQEGILFPVLLTNRDSVSAFQILIQYDLTAVDVVTAVTPDSVYIALPSQDSGSYYAPNIYPPEYFSIILEPGGHRDRVQLTAIMDMDLPPVTPSIPPGDEQLLFCLVVDTKPAAAGHTALFAFRTYDCNDNTLAGSDGYTLWGPTREFSPSWVCPERPDSLRAVGFEFGALVVQEVMVGDLNLNGIPYEIADAVVFINYLIYGTAALVDPDVQTPASDINQDGICWNIADLVMLLNIINEIPKSFSSLTAESVVVNFHYDEANGMVVEMESQVPIGGAYFVLGYNPALVELENPTFGFSTEMSLESNLTDNELRVVFFSWDCRRAPTGKRVLFTIPANLSASASGPDIENLIEVKEVSFSDASGSVLDVEISYGNRMSNLLGRLEVSRNFPNPFYNETSILFTLPADAQVKLEIFDPAGRLVKNLADREFSPGTHRATWDGRDEQGKSVPSGVYFYRITIDDFEKVGKMLFIK